MQIDKLANKIKSPIFSTKDMYKVFNDKSRNAVSLHLHKLLKYKFIHRIAKGLYTHDPNKVNLIHLGQKLIEPHPCYLSLETLLINAGIISEKYFKYFPGIDKSYLPPQSKTLSKAKYASKDRFAKAKKPKTQKQIFLETIKPRLNFHLTFVSSYKSMKRTIELPLKVNGNYSKPFIRKITYEYSKIAPNLFFGFQKEPMPPAKAPKKTKSNSKNNSLNIASLEKALLDYVYIRRLKQRDVEELNLNPPKKFDEEKFYKLLKKFPNWMQELSYE